MNLRVYRFRRSDLQFHRDLPIQQFILLQNREALCADLMFHTRGWHEARRWLCLQQRRVLLPDTPTCCLLGTCASGRYCGRYICISASSCRVGRLSDYKRPGLGRGCQSPYPCSHTALLHHMIYLTNEITARVDPVVGYAHTGAGHTHTAHRNMGSTAAIVLCSHEFNPRRTLFFFGLKCFSSKKIAAPAGCC